MRARDIMTPDVITATPETDIATLVRLMLEHRIGAVPIAEDGRLVGIVSEADLLRRPELGTAAPRPRWLLLIAGAAREEAAYVRAHGRTASEVMTRDPVTIAEDAPIETIAALMQRHRIKRLP
ncbi:MAG: CBS domain-containing protein, partial [Rhodospirillales bacterium]|nr:CBS domain-containing protein [Rhodospirillales bacterium]